jgi:hypothetical protein
VLRDRAHIWHIHVYLAAITNIIDLEKNCKRCSRPPVAVRHGAYLHHKLRLGNRLNKITRMHMHMQDNLALATDLYATFYGIDAQAVSG